MSLATLPWRLFRCQMSTTEAASMIRPSLVGLVFAIAATVGVTTVGIRSKPAPRAGTEYTWSRVTDTAAFDGAYNFPVFVVRNEMWAFHPRGHWYSRDAKSWRRSDLPLSGLNSGYQKYVAFHDAVYALGSKIGRASCRERVWVEGGVGGLQGRGGE